MSLFDDVYRLTFEGDESAVRELVQQHPELIHAKNENRETLLHAACWTKQVTLAQWLLEHQSDVKALGWHGMSPLHYSVYEGGLNTPTMTALQAAAAASPKLIKLLLDYHADPDIEDIHGFTPAELAKRDMEEGLPEVLTSLFAASRRYVLPDMSQWPALHKRIFLGDHNVFLILRNHPELINTLSSVGLAPLHVACWARQLMIGVLIGNIGADVNLQGTDGRTPLHYAVHEEGALNAVIVGVLLSAGADANIKDDQGYTPAEWAKQRIRRGLEFVLEEFEKAKRPRHFDFGKG